MSKQTYKTEGELIRDILQACKANEVPNLDSLFLELAFCTQSTLIKIARDLHIKVTA